MTAEDFDPLGEDGVARELSIGPRFFVFQGKSYVDLEWKHHPKAEGSADRSRRPLHILNAKPRRGWKAAPGLSLKAAGYGGPAGSNYHSHL